MTRRRLPTWWWFTVGLLIPFAVAALLDDGGARPTRLEFPAEPPTAYATTAIGPPVGHGAPGTGR